MLMMMMTMMTVTMMTMMRAIIIPCKHQAVFISQYKI
jgi:hypothetical protein